MALAGLGGAAPARAQAPPPDDAPPEEPTEQGAATAERPLEVVVHGSERAPIVSLRDPTVAAYVIRTEELAAPGLSAAEALARVPGVQITRGGGSSDVATASLRGATSAQTPIYLAGIRLNDDLTGTVDLATVPLWMLDRVEIYRGNAPDDSDVLGIGGAVRFEPRLPRRPLLGVGWGVGSWGAREAYSVGAIGDGEASALAAVRIDRADNDFPFDHDGGTAFDPADDRSARRRNADSSGVDVWSVGRVRTAQRSGADLTMVFNAMAREAGAPGLQLIAARHARAELSRVLAGATSRVPCSAGETAAGCQLELGTSAMLSSYALLDPQRELGGASQVVNRGRRLTQRARMRLPLRGELTLRFGGTQELGQLDVDVERARATRAARSSTRLDLGARYRPVAPLTFALTSAMECHSTRASGSDGAEGDTCGVLEPVGRLGASWRIAEPLALLANVGRYVRVPTLGELYGSSAIVRGNPELQSEQSITADLGATWTDTDGQLSGYAQAVGFVRHADDLIGYRRSSFGVIRPYNIAAARVLGLETAAGGGLWGIVFAGAALTALDPRDVSDDSQLENDLLPFQARLVVSPHLEIRTPEGWPTRSIQRTSLVVRYRYRSSRVADPAGLIGLEEQGQLDLELAVSLFRNTLRVRGRLENLLDQQNVDLVGYPLPGRSMYLNMEAWL